VPAAAAATFQTFYDAMAQLSGGRTIVVDDGAAALGASAVGSGLLRYGRLAAALQLASMTATTEERGGQKTAAAGTTHRQLILHR
jgi:hypothetical protein